MSDETEIFYCDACGHKTEHSVCERYEYEGEEFVHWECNDCGEER